MNWTEVGLVWRKETLDTLRDRRTILAMIVLPLLLYPVLIIGVSQLGIHQVEKLAESPARVAIVPRAAAPALVDSLRADKRFLVVAPGDPEAALRERTLDVLVRVPQDFSERLTRLDTSTVTVEADLSRDRGSRMQGRTTEFLRDWRSGVVARHLTRRRLPPAVARPFAVSIVNVAEGRKMAGSLAGKVLPFFLVVMMMTGAFYPAIDVTAGERERGTLETLLVSPAGRFPVVLGKFLTVFLASMVTTLANLISIAFTVFILLRSLDLGGTVTADVISLVNWRAILLIFLVMIPMALFFSAMSLLVASFARSFKEAQNYLSPLVIACMTPAYLAFLPGIEMSRGLALVPIANVVLLSRELLLGNVVWSFLVITMGTMTALALLLLQRAVSIFGSETMLTGTEVSVGFSWRNLFRRGKGPRPGVFGPAVVVPVFLVVLLGFFYIGMPLQLDNVKRGLVLTQLLVFAGIPIVSLRVLGIPVRRSLRVGPPRRLTPLALALAIAPAATLLAAWVGMGQGLFLKTPESYQQLMERLFRAQAGEGLWLAILVFAVVPGVCEEILFRGFVLRGLLHRLSPGRAIFWTAVLFGLFHFDLYRLLPTTVLGLVLGWVAWTTGSLWPAMILHAANNMIAVLTTNQDALGGIPWLREGASIPLPVILLVAGVGAAGVWGLWRLREQPSPAEDRQRPT